MKNKIGKPRKFKTTKELVDVLEKYFNETDSKNWTVTGLSLLVGSKQLLNDYGKRKNFKEVVVTAKLMVENAYEISLRKNGRAGDIFALKNFGWKDKAELAHTGKDGGAIKTKTTFEFIDSDARQDT